MGLKKIKIELIPERRGRLQTFLKRAPGLLKKAHELSTLTKARVMLITEKISTGELVVYHGGAPFTNEELRRQVPKPYDEARLQLSSLRPTYEHNAPTRGKSKKRCACDCARKEAANPPQPLDLTQLPMIQNNTAEPIATAPPLPVYDANNMLPVIPGAEALRLRIGAAPNPLPPIQPLTPGFFQSMSTHVDFSDAHLLEEALAEITSGDDDDTSSEAQSPSTDDE